MLITTCFSRLRRHYEGAVKNTDNIQTNRNLITALFWVVTQRLVVIYYWRCGTDECFARSVINYDYSSHYN